MTTVEDLKSEAVIAPSDTKIDNFDKEVKALIKQSREIIQARYKTSIELGAERAELVALNNYLNIYHKTAPAEHTGYFESLYERKRRAILMTIDDDTWMRQGAVIQFGEGVKSNKDKEERLKQIKIPLSDIYNIALELQEKAKKALEGIDEKFISEDKDLVRPNLLLLHLLRIFYHLGVNEGKDNKELLSLINHLETQLNIEKKTGSEVALGPVSPAAGGLAGLFTMATSMMEKLGVKLPPGMIKPPTESEISNVINKVFNDQSTQSTVKNLVETLQGGNDLNTTFQELVKNITDPRTLEALQTTIGNSIQTSLKKTN